MPAKAGYKNDDLYPAETNTEIQNTNDRTKSRDWADGSRRANPWLIDNITGWRLPSKPGWQSFR
jgi:hypothetical protein